MTKDPYRAVLTRALEHALDYLERLDERAVSAQTTLPELRARLVRPLGEAPRDPLEVLDDLVQGIHRGIIGNAGGRFLGSAIGGALPAALAADWLTSTWNQTAATYDTAPAASVVEEACGAWLKDLLGLPPRRALR